jgi:hypothetical protein
MISYKKFLTLLALTILCTQAHGSTADAQQLVQYQPEPLLLLAADFILRDHLPQDLDEQIPTSVQNFLIARVEQQKQYLEINGHSLPWQILLKQLYKANVDMEIHRKDKDGYFWSSTILELAIRCKQENEVKFLLKRGANSNKKSIGTTKFDACAMIPLEHALNSTDNIFLLMLDYKADPNLNDNTSSYLTCAYLVSRRLEKIRSLTELNKS